MNERQPPAASHGGQRRWPWLQLTGGLVLAAILLLAAFSVAGWVANGMQDVRPAQQAGAASTRQATGLATRFSGSVQSFDGGSLTLQTAAGARTVQVTAATHIQLWNGLNGNTRDLLRGLEVNVSATANGPGGGLLAQSIDIQRGTN